MIRFLYNLIWPFALLLFLPGYILKMFRRGGYRKNFGQRLGFYDSKLRRMLAGRSSTWIHAVSVGEVRIALKLAAELRNLIPDFHAVLTTTTTTGFHFAKRHAPAELKVLYSPLDFWPIMRRAFTVIQPTRVILIEAEVWPNLIAEARSRAIPVVLANARLSARSENRFRLGQFFIRATFRALDLVCVQEPEDLDRWAALGVSRERIRCSGSIKFDSATETINPALAEQVLRERNIDLPRPILLGGSTHRGEEETLARTFLGLRQEFPSLFLILVPRHVERSREVRRVVEQLGLRVALRSEPAGEKATDCLLVDSTGELRNWYGVATVVFIGKTLSARGGQNPVEAIAAGKPVLFGPHMENFWSLAESLGRAKGAIRINSADELKSAIGNLLRNQSRRDEIAANARTVLEKHRGATALTAQLIVNLPAKVRPKMDR